MLKSIFTIIISFILIGSCGEKNQKKAADKKFIQLMMKEENSTPTVYIEDYALITANPKSDSIEGREIMKLKRALPLAVQSKDSAFYKNLFGSHYVFRADDEYYNNIEEYIKARTASRDTVIHVKYENLALQIFDNYALLSYRNIVDNKGYPHGSGSVHMNWKEYMSWADIYIKENGQWKIGSIHLVEYRNDVPVNK